jgi:hypothetical protein
LSQETLEITTLVHFSAASEAVPLQNVSGLMNNAASAAMRAEFILNEFVLKGRSFSCAEGFRFFPEPASAGGRVSQLRR